MTAAKIPSIANHEAWSCGSSAALDISVDTSDGFVVPKLFNAFAASSAFYEIRGKVFRNSS